MGLRLGALGAERLCALGVTARFRAAAQLHRKASLRSFVASADAGITKSMLIDKPNVQVVHVTCRPGAIEPPGPHPYDVVLVPLNQAPMAVSIEGKSIKWSSGEPIYIPRGVQHNVSNKGHETAELLSIRIL